MCDEMKLLMKLCDALGFKVNSVHTKVKSEKTGMEYMKIIDYVLVPKDKDKEIQDAIK